MPVGQTACCTVQRPLPPPALGRFDFPKFSLIFAPVISIILFYIYKDLEKVLALKDETSLDAKEANLYIVKMPKLPKN